MQPGYDYKQFAVLFVDDEDKALKYFKLAFGKELRILTASSVAEALEHLRRDGDDIGILVTDQRMPEHTGVELLKHVRQHHPEIVRILTTAYSELGDAVEAVNRGEIYRYVTKPWDIQALRAELRQAMEFFLLRRERDLLLEEKLNVLQRMVQADRARDLIVMAGALGGIRHSLQALRAFFAQPQLGPGEPSKGELPDWMRMDYWSVAQAETARSLEIGAYLSRTLSSDVVPGSFPHALTVRELLADAASTVSIPVDTHFEAEAAIKVDAALAKRLFGLLVSLAGAGAVPPARLKLSAGPSPATGPGGPFVQVKLALEGPRPESPPTAEGVAPLLAAHLISCHHGGELRVDFDPESGSRLSLKLPSDPSAVTLPPPPDNWLDQVFSHYEGWEE